jgi:5-methylcytosine-specific restriction endonuclease McrBC regulatory subunit McrC
MRQRLEARQAEETASALDRVNEPKNVRENFRVVRLLFETHEFDVDNVQILCRLGQEFAKQVIHNGYQKVNRPRVSAAPRKAARFSGECRARPVKFD